MLKRHKIQVLRRAGHSQIEIAKLAGVSRRSVQRVETDEQMGYHYAHGKPVQSMDLGVSFDPVTHLADLARRARRELT